MLTISNEHHHPEAERVQRVLHRLALRVEQRRARHHAHLDAVAGHDAVPPPGGERPRVRCGKVPPVDPPSVITMGPAISASSSSEASRNRPSTLARKTPYAM